MVDFGDEFTIESYRIPWLIWIQLLVFVLLVFLLYCFSFLASNHSDRTTASPSASHLVSQETQKEKPIPKNNSTTVVSNCFEISQVGEGVIKGEISTSTGRREGVIKGEIATSTSRRLVRGEENNTERELGSSATHTYHHPWEQRNREEWYNLYSPCYICEQLIAACLKCLGYDDSTAQNAHHHPPPSHAERGDEFVVSTATRSSMASRRPPRPPLSSGGGGQINESSS
ncbi:hypothetical protein FH972_002748 [Carpinus fangiana]|uniref:Uncharacterized protein n=1 Tax=Carpinus fangiana TaxID=176857 RepID=A0A5N6QHQ1_9ROSI|nr:hypothetical protein FH972_002748 [Carpinus fangiana]